MADSPSNRVLRQAHRLFHFGAVGSMSDAELLDRFVSRRDEAAARSRLRAVTPVVPTMPRMPFRRSSSSWPTGPGQSAGAGRSRAGCSGLRIASRSAVSVAPHAGARSTISSRSGSPRAISRRRTISMRRSCTRRSIVCPGGCALRSCSAGWRDSPESRRHDDSVGRWGRSRAGWLGGASDCGFV